MNQLSNNLTEKPIYQLVLDEGGLRQELWQKYSRSRKINYWLGIGLSIIDIILFIHSFPNYDFSDFITLFGFGVPAIIFLARSYQKAPDYFYYYLDEEKIEYFTNHWFGVKTIYWADIQRVYINENNIKLVLKKNGWSKIKLQLFRINQNADAGQTVQELKLAFRSFCIRLGIELIEFPDCRKEQEVTRKIKKKISKNNGNTEF